MQTQPTDPFAKGAKLKCIKGAWGLTVERVYESIESCGRAKTVKVHSDKGDAGYYFRSNFEPVPAAGEKCASVWREVDRNETHRLYEGRTAAGRPCFAVSHVDDSEADAVPCGEAAENVIELGERGFRSRFIESRGWSECSYTPRSAPPQPEQAKAACSHQGVSATGTCLGCGKELGVWDSDRYNGIVPTSNLDARIAAVKAEHAASSKRSGLLETFPKDARNPR